MAETSKNTTPTLALSPKRILASLTYITECATNHSLRFSMSCEFSRTMEIRNRGLNRRLTSEITSPETMELALKDV